VHIPYNAEGSMLHILEALQFWHLFCHMCTYIFYKEMIMFPSFRKYYLGLCKGASLQNCCLCLLPLQPEPQVHLSSNRVQVV
jgi:hypothetical protein